MQAAETTVASETILAEFCELKAVALDSDIAQQKTERVCVCA